MTVETRDILLKAAEDVQQGMWCRSAWFRKQLPSGHLSTVTNGPHEFFRDKLIQQRILSRPHYRCAEGSIAIATYLMGGDEADYDRTIIAVIYRLGMSLSVFNDTPGHLPDDPFEAGQQLAELFRSTAESL